MGAQIELGLGSSILRFYSRNDAMVYMRALIDYYQQQSQQYGDKLGSLLRNGGQSAAQPAPAKDKGKDGNNNNKAKGPRKGWARLGTVLVNSTDPSTANAEIMFQVQEEMKLKLARTTEALKSLDLFSEAGIPDGAAFLVYVKNGVPEAFIAGPPDRKTDAFNYAGRFKVV